MCLGTDYAHKNRDLAIAVHRELAERGRRFTLVLAGPSVPFGGSAKLGATAAPQTTATSCSSPRVTRGSGTGSSATPPSCSTRRRPRASGSCRSRRRASGARRSPVGFGPLLETSADLPVVASSWDRRELADCVERLVDDPVLRREQVSATLAAADRYSWRRTAEEFRPDVPGSPRPSSSLSACESVIDRNCCGDVMVRNLSDRLRQPTSPRPELERELDRLSVEQALRDFEIANARTIDLTQRLVDLSHEVTRSARAARRRAGGVRGCPHRERRRSGHRRPSASPSSPRRSAPASAGDERAGARRRAPWSPSSSTAAKSSCPPASSRSRASSFPARSTRWCSTTAAPTRSGATVRAQCEALGVGYYRSPRNMGIPRNMNLALLHGADAGYDYVVDHQLRRRVPVEPRLRHGVHRARRSGHRVGHRVVEPRVVVLAREPRRPRRCSARRADRPGLAPARGAFRAAARRDPGRGGLLHAVPVAMVDEVGLFDPIFGRGYCEEVDWCLRAEGVRLPQRAGTVGVRVPHRQRDHEDGRRARALGDRPTRPTRPSSTCGTPPTATDLVAWDRARRSTTCARRRPPSSCWRAHASSATWSRWRRSRAGSSSTTGRGSCCHPIPPATHDARDAGRLRESMRARRRLRARPARALDRRAAAGGRRARPAAPVPRARLSEAAAARGPGDRHLQLPAAGRTAGPRRGRAAAVTAPALADGASPERRREVAECEQRRSGTAARCRLPLPRTHRCARRRGGRRPGVRRRRTRRGSVGPPARPCAQRDAGVGEQVGRALVREQHAATIEPWQHRHDVLTRRTRGRRPSTCT